MTDSSGCSYCDGDGWQVPLDGHSERCEACDGTGRVLAVEPGRAEDEDIKAGRMRAIAMLRGESVAASPEDATDVVHLVVSDENGGTLDALGQRPGDEPRLRVVES